MKTVKLFLALIILIFIPSLTLAQYEELPNEERILQYHTVVDIQPDSSLEVTESITVVALNDEINRGIYRDFPTEYKTNLGINSNTSFDVINVWKNKEPEPYFTESYANGVRLYVGQSDVFIDPGIYTYVIKYKTDRQITHLEETDGLLYNMTGNGWVFPIDKSSGEIRIPADLEEGEFEYVAYWGLQGSDNQEGIDIEITREDGMTIISYVNNNPMDSYEGLTAGTIFPKGIVEEYTSQDAILDLIIDNLVGIAVLFTAFVFVLLSAFLMLRYGSDPKGKTIYPQFDIPENLSPGLARYIDKMGYDNKVITSTVVSLGSKGILKMTEEKKRFSKEKYILELTDPKDVKSWNSVPTDERDFLENFFSAGQTVITFSGKYSKTIKSSVDSFKTAFKSRNSGYITSNAHIYGPVILAAILIPAAIVGLGVMILGLQFSILVIPGILIIILCLMPLPFVLKNRTREGRDLQDTIEGLKMFILATEEEKIKIMHNKFPKDMKTFNKFFPYAMALGLDTQWLSQFKSVIDQAQMENPDGTYTYGWYTGHRAFNSSSFGSGLNSAMVGSIAASATPPSQSGGGGGFSGGGFSGGGGGGGGGGGW